MSLKPESPTGNNEAKLRTPELPPLMSVLRKAWRPLRARGWVVALIILNLALLSGFSLLVTRRVVIADVDAILLVDSSTVVYQEPSRRETEGKVVQEFVEYLTAKSASPSSNRVSLLLFGSSVAETLSLTFPDVSRIEERLGFTDMGESIYSRVLEAAYTGFERAESFQVARQAVVVIITPGEPNPDLESRDVIRAHINRLVTQGVRIYVVSIGWDVSQEGWSKVGIDEEHYFSVSDTPSRAEMMTVNESIVKAVKASPLESTVLWLAIGIIITVLLAPLFGYRLGRQEEWSRRIGEELADEVQSFKNKFRDRLYDSAAEDLKKIFSRDRSQGLQQVRWGIEEKLYAHTKALSLEDFPLKERVKLTLSEAEKSGDELKYVLFLECCLVGILSPSDREDRKTLITSLERPLASSASDPRVWNAIAEYQEDLSKRKDISEEVRSAVDANVIDRSNELNVENEEWVRKTYPDMIARRLLRHPDTDKRWLQAWEDVFGKDFLQLGEKPFSSAMLDSIGVAIRNWHEGKPSAKALQAMLVLVNSRDLDDKRNPLFRSHLAHALAHAGTLAGAALDEALDKGAAAADEQVLRKSNFDRELYFAYRDILESVASVQQRLPVALDYVRIIIRPYDETTLRFREAVTSFYLMLLSLESRRFQLAVKDESQHEFTYQTPVDSFGVAKHYPAWGRMSKVFDVLSNKVVPSEFQDALVAAQEQWDIEVARFLSEAEEENLVLEKDLVFRLDKDLIHAMIQNLLILWRLMGKENGL